MMAGLPVSLAIAIWFVAALWVVGAMAYYFDYPAELRFIVRAARPERLLQIAVDAHRPNATNACRRCSNN